MMRSRRSVGKAASITWIPGACSVPVSLKRPRHRSSHRVSPSPGYWLRAGQSVRRALCGRSSSWIRFSGAKVFSSNVGGGEDTLLTVFGCGRVRWTPPSVIQLCQHAMALLRLKRRGGTKVPEAHCQTCVCDQTSGFRLTFGHRAQARCSMRPSPFLTVQTLYDVTVVGNY